MSFLYVRPSEPTIYTPVLLENPACSSDGSYCVALSDLAVYTTMSKAIYELAKNLSDETAATGMLISEDRWAAVLAALQSTNPLDE